MSSTEGRGYVLPHQTYNWAASDTIATTECLAFGTDLVATTGIRRMICPLGCTLSNLVVVITTNNNTSAGATFTIQTSGSDLIPDTLSSLSVTLTADAGTFEDNTNTVVIPPKTAFNLLYTEQDSTVVCRGAAVVGIMN